MLEEELGLFALRLVIFEPSDLFVTTYSCK
jgi:hypothetical protein